LASAEGGAAAGAKGENAFHPSTGRGTSKIRLISLKCKSARYDFILTILHILNILNILTLDFEYRAY
jgi:hypothetical protein